MEFDNFLHILGMNIKFVRMKKNLTQAQFAELISVHENNISKIERGKINISMKTLYKIAAALDVEPCVLMKSN